jgi:hypothetical protein
LPSILSRLLAVAILLLGPIAWGLLMDTVFKAIGLKRQARQARKAAATTGCEEGNDA